MTVVEQLAEVWQRVARGLSCNCLLPHAAQTSDAPHGAAFALLRGEDDRERDETPSTNERGMRRPTGWAVPVRNNMADASAGDAGHSAHLRNFGGGSAFDGGDGGMGSQGNAARAEEGEGRGPPPILDLGPRASPSTQSMPKLVASSERESVGCTVSADSFDHFGDAGRQCRICESECRRNTHFAMPCKHAACRRCWSRWLETARTCMICCSHVDAVHRFDLALVPVLPCEPHFLSCRPQPGEQGYEAYSAFEMINPHLEVATHDLSACLCHIVDTVEHRQRELAETLDHLSGLCSMPAETRHSVATVEMGLLEGLLDRISDLLPEQGPDASAVHGVGTGPMYQVHDAMTRTKLRLEQIDEALEDYFELQAAPDLLESADCSQAREVGVDAGSWGPVVDGRSQQAAARQSGLVTGPRVQKDADAKPLAGLDATLRILKEFGFAVAVVAQWEKASNALRVIVDETIPDVLLKIQQHGALDAASCWEAKRLQPRVDRCLHDTSARIRALQPEFELTAIRVQSCFDFGGCDTGTETQTATQAHA